MPYYKRDTENIYSGSQITGPDGLELTEDNQTSHTYPVSGWWWFDNLDQALIHFAALAPPEFTDRRISKFQFRSRFTNTERVAIELAQIDVATAPPAQRQLAAALRASLQDIAVSAHVDLDLQATRNGVLQLEALGLLAPGRALQILDGVSSDSLNAPAAKTETKNG